MNHAVPEVADRLALSRAHQNDQRKHGREGVVAFRAHAKKIRLVLLDLLLPIMGREETLDRLREIRADVPVILITGFNESEAVRRLGPRKYDAFLQKPYGFDELLEIIARVLPVNESNSPR